MRLILIISSHYDSPGTGVPTSGITIGLRASLASSGEAILPTYKKEVLYKDRITVRPSVILNMGLPLR